MITRFCPNCYAENRDTDTCVVCGAPLIRGDAYLTKLAWALRHPEPETALRAAAVLERLGAEAGPVVPRLLEVLAGTRDVYFRAQLLRALAAIDREQALPLLRQALQDPSAIVRQAAAEALQAPEP